MILLVLSGFIWPPSGLASTNRAFAYGVRLDQEGGYVEIALEIAAGLGIDWLAVTLDWAAVQPQEHAPADLARLASLLTEAEARQIPVLLSITNAPVWAMSERGPLPGPVAGLLSNLAGQFPAVEAIELFPGANTTRGWGTTPDAEAYLKMFRRAADRLSEEGRQTQLIAAGLQPLASEHSIGDQDDLSYLKALYQAGGAAWISTLSVQFTETTGLPMSSPFQSEARVLRHYELVRQVMLVHGHQQSQLWVTRFSWPQGNIAEADQIFADPQKQAQWLHEAYNLFNSQLYIRVAFFDGLNPSSSYVGLDSATSLIKRSGELHPGLFNLGQLTRYGEEKSALVENQSPTKTLLWKKVHLKAASSSN